MDRALPWNLVCTTTAKVVSHEQKWLMGLGWARELCETARVQWELDLPKDQWPP
jgi:hypothetical protein